MSVPRVRELLVKARVLDLQADTLERYAGRPGSSPGSTLRDIDNARALRVQAAGYRSEAMIVDAEHGNLSKADPLLEGAVAAFRAMLRRQAAYLDDLADMLDRLPGRKQRKVRAWTGADVDAAFIRNEAELVRATLAAYQEAGR
ncbi:MAG TPA: hypothetical protein VFR97_02305 [Capillimicrobium sp.]|nr:hypothetical protein [Capillimicrobium sp.]